MSLADWMFAAALENKWRHGQGHVMPVRDLREHTISDCWCDPVDDDGVMLHNSLDEREVFEAGRRKPS